MDKKSILRVLPIVGTLVALAIMPVSAQVISVNGSASLGISSTNTAAGSGNSGSATVNTGVSAGGNGLTANLKVTAETRVVNRADQEITRRINALNALSTRVNAMVKLSDTEKTSLSSTIAAQISAMNSLQSQVSADASNTTALKADVQSITKSYRIFALVIPQGAIDAMADRVMTIVSDMQTISTKLQTRISEAQSSGADMSVAVSALADLNSKTADANTQSQAAVNEVSSLQPDNGNQAQMQSNTSALQDAHAKLKVSQQDLIAARKDAGVIVKAIESVTVKTSATSSSSVNATGSQ